MVCHSRAANFVLGLTESQMNRDFQYGHRTDNQLRVLEHLGKLKVDWAAYERDAVARVVSLIVPTLLLMPPAVRLIVLAVPLTVPAVVSIVRAVLSIDFARPAMSRAVASVVSSKPCSGLALDKIEEALART